MAARLGQLGKLNITAEPSAAAGSAVLGGLLFFVARRVLELSGRQALVGSVLGVAGHWVSDIWHHNGHAIAARQSGYPMTGINLHTVLGASLYPAAEPPLAAAIHRRRALGGPLASLALTLASGGVAFALRGRPGVAQRLAQFVFLDNLLIFTGGALMPLGFTDGSTLLRLRGQSYRLPDKELESVGSFAKLRREPHSRSLSEGL